MARRALSKLAGALSAVLVAGLVAAAPVPAAAATPGCAPFQDVSSSGVHCDNIAWLKAQGLTKPQPTWVYNGQEMVQVTLYRPDAPVTRGAMVTFLKRIAGDPYGWQHCGSQFPDMVTGNEHCAAAGWASDNFVAYGFPDGRFRSAAPVTRGAMAAFIYRLAHPYELRTPGFGPAKCKAQPYPDVPVSSEFCGVITWLKDQGLTSGYPDGTFGPARSVSRAQMATFLKRIVTQTDIPTHQPWAEQQPACDAQCIIANINTYRPKNAPLTLVEYYPGFGSAVSCSLFGGGGGEFWSDDTALLAQSCNNSPAHAAFMKDPDYKYASVVYDFGSDRDYFETGVVTSEKFTAWSDRPGWTPPTFDFTQGGVQVRVYLMDAIPSAMDICLNENFDNENRWELCWGLDD